MPEWDAEVTVDGVLVRSLLSEQFPELDARSARLLGEGWDNSVWVVEESWAFRFPRRAIAIPGVEREISVLPRLAPLLPAPIPEPRFVGTPSERFPWPFFGAPLLAGREPADADLGRRRSRRPRGGARTLLARASRRGARRRPPRRPDPPCGHALPGREDPRQARGSPRLDDTDRSTPAPRGGGATTTEHDSCRHARRPPHAASPRRRRTALRA